MEAHEKWDILWYSPYINWCGSPSINRITSSCCFEISQDLSVDLSSSAGPWENTRCPGKMRGVLRLKQLSQWQAGKWSIMEKIMDKSPNPQSEPHPQCALFCWCPCVNHWPNSQNVALGLHVGVTTRFLWINWIKVVFPIESERCEITSLCLWDVSLPPFQGVQIVGRLSLSDLRALEVTDSQWASKFTKGCMANGISYQGFNLFGTRQYRTCTD